MSLLELISNIKKKLSENLKKDISKLNYIISINYRQNHEFCNIPEEIQSKQLKEVFETIEKVKNSKKIIFPMIILLEVEVEDLETFELLFKETYLVRYNPN